MALHTTEPRLYNRWLSDLPASVLVACVCASEAVRRSAETDGCGWTAARRNDRNNNWQADTTTIECGERVKPCDYNKTLYNV